MAYSNAYLQYLTIRNGRPLWTPGDSYTASVPAVPFGDGLRTLAGVKLINIAAGNTDIIQQLAQVQAVSFALGKNLKFIQWDGDANWQDGTTWNITNNDSLVARYLDYCRQIRDLVGVGNYAVIPPTARNSTASTANKAAYLASMRQILAGLPSLGILTCDMQTYLVSLNGGLAADLDATSQGLISLNQTSDDVHLLQPSMTLGTAFAKAQITDPAGWTS